MKKKSKLLLVRVLAALAAIACGIYAAAVWVYANYERSYFPDNPGVFSYSEFWISVLFFLYFAVALITGSFFFDARSRNEQNQNR